MSELEMLQEKLNRVQFKADVLMVVTAQICVENNITPDTLIARFEAMELEVLGNMK